MLDQLRAHTQYGDLSGTIAIDGHSSPPQHDLAEEAGIDTNRFFPIGIRITNAQTGEVEVLAIDRELAATEDALDEYLRENEAIDIKCFPTGRKLSDLGQYVKRIEIVAIQKGFERLRTADVRIT